MNQNIRVHCITVHVDCELNITFRMTFPIPKQFRESFPEATYHSRAKTWYIVAESKDRDDILEKMRHYQVLVRDEKIKELENQKLTILSHIKR